MPRNIFLLLLSLLLTLTADAQLQWGWAKSVGGSGDDHYKKIATDSRNGVYTFGSFKSSSFLVGSTTITNAGGSDLLLVKYDTLGNVIWAKSFGSTGDDTAYSITTDKSSNILIAGSFKNSINFGSTTLTSAGGSDPFFVKLDGNGTVIWAKQHTGSLEDKAEVIKADIYNNIYLAGRYKSNDLVMDGTTFTAPSSTTNLFYCKLDSNGNFKWKKTNTSASSHYYVTELEFFNPINTSFILAGDFVNNTGGGMTFNPSPFSTGLTTPYSATFQVRLDSAGNYVSQSQAGSRDRSGGIAVSKNSKVQESLYHVDLTFNANTARIRGDFGGNSTTTCACINDQLTAPDIIVTGSNRLFTVGPFAQSSTPTIGINFNNGFIIPSPGGTSRAGIYVWETDSTSVTRSLLYATLAFAPSNLDGTKLSSIALDTITNTMFVAGNFTATAGFNFNIGSNTLVSAGASDAFLAKVTADPDNLRILAGPDTTICSGSSVTIGSATGATGGSAPYTYSWSPTTGLASPNSSSTVATPTVTTSYIITVTDAALNTAKDTVVVNVSTGPPPPTPSITPGGPTSFCAGGSVMLTSSTVGAAGYLWSTGATTQSITVNTSGNYSVQTIGAGGCFSNSSLPTVVTVNSPTTPVITASGPTTFCPGGSVTLTSSPASAYLWSTGATTQSIIVSAAGTYSVTVTNSFGCSAASTPVTVTLNPAPPLPSILPLGPTTFCQGGSVTLASSSGSGNLWSNGATGSTTVVSTSGSYFVTVTNGFGCSAVSSPIVVTVNPLPSVPVITASGATTFCQGGSVTLTSSASTGNLWSTGATTQSINVTAAGNYSVTVTNGSGCSATSTTTIVTVNPLPPVPVITASGPTSFCQGGSVTLTSSAATGNLWNTGATTQSINVTAAGNYSVTATNGFGCIAVSATTTVTVNPLPAVPVISASGPTSFCQGGSVTLTSSAPTGNLWSTGATTQSINVTTTGNYSVTVTNGFGCSAVSATTTVTVNPLPAIPAISASGPTTFCQGGSVTLTSSAASGYLWSTGATTQSINVTAAGNYSVTVTNSFGCSAASAPVTITVNPLPAVPVISASGPTTFCQGGSVTLTSSAASGNLWSTGATTQSINVTTTGNYSVTISTGPGCSATSLPVSVTVNPVPPIPTITQNGNLLTSSSATGNQWFFNGVAIPGATAQTYTYPTGGQYSVTVTNASGCTASSSSISVLRMASITLRNGDPFLYNVYPNPADKNANLSYILRSAADVSIILVSSSGNRVSILLNKQQQSAGVYNRNFSNIASTLNNGMYFIVFEINGQRVPVNFIIEK